jgi:uncharacterized membrane protein YdfJ with MMPL/SSD domain
MDLSREDSLLQHALLRPSQQSEVEDDENDDSSDDDDNGDEVEEDDGGTMLGLLHRRRRAGRVLRSCCQQPPPPDHTARNAMIPTSSFHRISFNCSNFWCPGVLPSSLSSSSFSANNDHHHHNNLINNNNNNNNNTLSFLDRYLRVLEQCRFVYLAMIVLVLWPTGSHSFRHLQEKVESSFAPLANTPSGAAQQAFATAYHATVLDPMNPPLILVLDSIASSSSIINGTTMGSLIAIPPPPSNNDSSAGTVTAYERARHFSTTLRDHLEQSICWKWMDTPRHECAKDGDWITVTSYYSLLDDEIDLEWIATRGYAMGNNTVLVQVAYTFPANETLHHKHRVVQLMQAIDDYYHNATLDYYQPYFTISYTGVKYFLSDLTLSTRHDLKRMDAIVLPIALILMGLVLPRANFWVVWMVPVVTLLTTVSLWSIVMNVIATRVSVSTFCPTVMMSLTMGLGIDYSLFLLSRYLQNESIADMLSSMSRVLAVSGLTLAASFAGLMLLPVSTLQSIGFGAVVAIATSLAVNLVTVPILLMTPLGRWIIHKPKPSRRCRRVDNDHAATSVPMANSSSSTVTSQRTQLQQPPPPPMPSIWFRIAKTVLHPYRGTILLLVLCQPITFLAERAWSLRTSLSFDRTLPSKSPSLQTYHRLADHFGPGSVNPYKILVDGRRANITMTSQRGFEIMEKVVQALERAATIGTSTVSSRFLNIPVPSLEEMNDSVFATTSPHHQVMLPSSSTTTTRKSPRAVSAMFNGISVLENVQIPFSVFVSAKFCTQMQSKCAWQLLRLVNWLDETYTSDDQYATIISATLNVDPFSDEGLRWLDQARAAIAALDLGDNNNNTATSVQVHIDGSSAIAHDTVNAVYAAFPMMMLTTCGVVFCLIGWYFQSLIAPLRSLISIGITVSVSFGLAVAVFQNGWLHWAGISFSSSSTGSSGDAAIGWLVPIMAFSILVGLTLDYDVFLVSRILEYRLEGYEHKSSIALGLDSTGGVITAAGLIMAVAFGSLMGSSNPVLYQWSFLLTTAILFDTFVVRTLIVPTLLAPTWSWWPRRDLPAAVHVADGFDTTGDDDLRALVQRLDESSDYVRL